MIYDPETNILSWEITKRPISHAVEFGNFIIHLSKSRQPILIEILDATKFIGQLGKIHDVKQIEDMLPAS